MTTSSTTPQPPATAPRPPKAPRAFKETPTLRGILIKIIGLGLLDAVVVYALFVLALKESWVALVAGAIGLLVLNWIYLSKRALPLKYLAPGLVFLLIFQVFVVGYSAYIAFTNFGDGHNSTQEDAVDAIVAKSLVRVENSPTYEVTILDQLGTYSFLVTDPDGTVSLGSADSPLEEISNAEVSGSGKAVASELSATRCGGLPPLIRKS